ncbi:hypothetical protein MMC22_002187 [Lobaria immixta]|nr:hypothetical protein [Lobaria immixta]
MLYLQKILGQVVLSFLFIRFTVTAAATSDHFINPPAYTNWTAPESTFTRGSLVQLNWLTNLTRIALTLRHSTSSDFEYLGNNATVPATANISNTDNSYLWLVDTKADISDPFFLAIFDPGHRTSAFRSQNFTIINAPPNPIAVITGSNLPGPSAFPAEPLAVSNGALSTGAKVGIGIGSAVFIVVLGLGMFLVGKRAKERKRIQQERDQNGQWTKTELAADDVDREARGYGPHMPASTERAEVEDTGVMREVLADSGPIFEAPGDLPAAAELSGSLRGGDALMQNNEFSR